MSLPLNQNTSNVQVRISKKAMACPAERDNLFFYFFFFGYFAMEFTLFSILLRMSTKFLLFFCLYFLCLTVNFMHYHRTLHRRPIRTKENRNYLTQRKRNYSMLLLRLIDGIVVE